MFLQEVVNSLLVDDKLYASDQEEHQSSFFGLENEMTQSSIWCF